MQIICFCYYIGVKYDQFKEFRIYLSNTSGVYGEPVYQHSTRTWQSPRYIIPVPIYNYMARFMKIDREENILTICEVKIYEGGENTYIVFVAIKLTYLDT